MRILNRVLFAIIGVGLIFWFGVQHQASPSLSFSADRLDRLTQYFQTAVDQQKLAGARAVIIQNGDVVYEHNWGMRNIEQQAPVQDDTIFQIYSMTKPIVSVAVLMLYEEGHFRLHDPIAKYIPELSNLRVYDEKGAGTPPTRAAARQPTIHDLLTHRAGFLYGFLDASPLGAIYRKERMDMPPDMTLQEYVAALGKIPLKFDPGSQWNYSVSTDVLGYLVEVVSGERLSAFLDKRIFMPLGMVDTSFKHMPEKEGRRAMLYSREGVAEQYPTYGFAARPTGAGLEVAHPLLFDMYAADAKYESGGGGLVSTTHDYLQFAQMLLNDGARNGVRLLAPNTVAMMRHDQIGNTPNARRIPPTMPGEGVGFGLGVGTITDQGLSGGSLPQGSYYWGGAAGTFFWVDPQNDLTAVFMTQILPDHFGLRQEFWTLTYQAISDPRLND